jgi:hypothetical protein
MYLYIFAYTNPDGINLNFHLEQEYYVGAYKYYEYMHAHLALVFVEIS